MKEIVKKPIYFKTTCNYCGVVFTYQLKDIEKNYPNKVACPYCHQSLQHCVENSIYEVE